MVYAGVKILKLEIRGFYLGLLAIMCVMSVLLIDESVRDALVAETFENRRSAQGLPVQDGQIETLQTVYPWSIGIGSALVLLGLLFARLRMKSYAEASAR